MGLVRACRVGPFIYFIQQKFVVINALVQFTGFAVMLCDIKSPADSVTSTRQTSLWQVDNGGWRNSRVLIFGHEE